MHVLSCGICFDAKVMAFEQGSRYLCSRLAAPRDLRQCLCMDRDDWIVRYDALGLRGVLDLTYDQNDIT